MRKIYYIGELPPPYGGVTVKNALIYNALFSDKNVEMIDMVECRRGIWRSLKCCLRLFFALMGKSNIIIGLGKAERQNFIIQIYHLLHGKKKLGRLHLFVMGGTFHDEVSQSEYLKKIIANVGSIWVEAHKMKESLEKMGAKNVFFFPNCRTVKGKIEPRKRQIGEAIRFVFYSKICKEKGIEYILQLKEYFEEKNLQVDFFGEIDTEVKSYFMECVEKSVCFNYCGIFDSVKGNVYEMLNHYDIMLFPTQWKGEGVPGVLVEAKFAGISVIATDWKYNKEIVVDGVEGIIISDGKELRSSIEQIITNSLDVEQLKKNSFESSLRYSIESYQSVIYEKIGII